MRLAWVALHHRDPNFYLLKTPMRSIGVFSIKFILCYSLRMKYIDLTHTFSSVMPVYPGDPQTELHQSATIDVDGFTDHTLHTSMHVGTHIDAPLHMISGGKSLSEFEVKKFFGRGVLVDARGLHEISKETIVGARIQKGDIVLFMTGHSAHFGTEAYFANYPYITEDCAEYLVDTEVLIIGMDTPSPDAQPFATHKILLKNDVLIVENLTNLSLLTAEESFQIVALPMKLEADAGPIRVVAVVPGA